MTDEEPDDFELDDKMRLARQNVPWRRSGYPGSAHLDDDRTKWGPYVLNIGIAPWCDRLKDDEWLKKIADSSMARSYLKERAFAEIWDYENNSGTASWRGKGGLLDAIIGVEVLQQIRLDDKTRHLMELTAQAVIQWLGTNCGQAFIHEAGRVCDNNLERLYPEDAERKREQEVAWRARDKQRVEQEAVNKEKEVVNKEKERIVSEAHAKINMLVEQAKADAVRRVESEMRERIQNSALEMYAERRDAEVPGLVQQVLLDRDEAARQDAERMVRESPLGGRRIIEV